MLMYCFAMTSWLNKRAYKEVLEEFMGSITLADVVKAATNLTAWR